MSQNEIAKGQVNLDGFAPADIGSSGTLHRTGFFTTAAGLRQERYLQEHGDQLRAYLLTRLRDVTRATDAYEDVASWLAQQTKDQLGEAPSIQAAYFRAARRFVGAQLAEGPIGALDDVPWEPAKPGSSVLYDEVLDAVRHGLGIEELELLELRYARRLKVDELSYVLDAPVDQLVIRLEAAMGFAALLSHEVVGAGSVNLARLLYDAFQVVPHELRAEYRARRRVPPKLTPKTQVGDRFEIIKCIGGGAFAWVYSARDVHVPGHRVALKVLHRPARTSPARKGAIRELSVIASAFHPSLVQLKEHGWHLDRLWFVMPWYDGETLGARLERERLSVKEAAQLFAPLARALTCLHAAGVVHRDVKPDNIFLVEVKGENGDVEEVIPVLLDLGVAAPEGDLALAGTPIYFAPEMAECIVDETATGVSSKADVFALALTFAHAVHGPPSLDGQDLSDFISNRARTTPAVVKTGRRVFNKMLRQALELDPRDRPSMGELGRAFQREGAGWRERRTSTSRMGFVVRWLGAAVLGVVLVGMAWAWRSEIEHNVLNEARQITLEAELSRQLDRANSLSCPD